MKNIIDVTLQLYRITRDFGKGCGLLNHMAKKRHSISPLLSFKK